MKRCPECDFLYHDEQERCDMDGTRLRFTTTLPADAVQTKSISRILTIPVLATIVLGIVLFICYPPRWHTSTFSPAGEMKPVNVNANADSQLPSEPSPHSS